MDPSFLSSRNPDPTRTKWRRGGNFVVVLPFFGGINFTKLKIILFFKKYKKSEPTDKIFKYFEPKKLLPSSQKYEFVLRKNSS
jgi:hypothetical protein